MSHRAVNQKRPIWGRLIASIVIVGLLIGGGVFAYNTLWGTYGDTIMGFFGDESDDYEGPGEGEAVITIYQGEVGSDVANSLEDAGVVKDAVVFYQLLLSNPSIEFMPGSYALKSQMSSEQALEALQDPDNKIERGAAVREGLTAEQTYEILAAGTGLDVEDFKDAASDIESFDLPKGVETIEGWLFPATYQFSPEEDAHDMLMTMVKYQKEILMSNEVSEKDQQRILTIASIIEKEAGIVSDFSRVSAVIHNRLDEGMLLGMDSTAQYGVGEHDSGEVWSTDEALTSENPWNTYVHVGLPVGPISNPGEAAVKAALSPYDGEMLYFVVAPGGTGESTFTNTIDEHDLAVAEYRIWCEETPDSGC